MKKFLVLAAFGLFAAPAVAQNTADIDQTGPGHDAEILQTGSNTAQATQTGVTNTAAIEQIGASNEAAVTQSGSDGYGGVWQGIEGAAATGAIGTITQTGLTETAYVVQGRHGHGSVVESSAEILQEGEDNFAYTIQGANATDVGSSAVVEQTSGSVLGVAYIFQGHGSGNASAGNSGSILQDAGSGNFAQIAQISEVWSGTGIVGENNTAEISQAGSGNDGRIYQGVAREWEVRFTGGSAFNNLGLIDQDGDDNLADISQGIDGADASNSSAFIYQYSDGNTGTILQSGDANTATITQQN